MKKPLEFLQYIRECSMSAIGSPDKGVLLKLVFLFPNQNICSWYSKEPSQ